MIKFLKVFFASVVLCLGLTSCIGGDDDAKRSDSFVNCFAYVEDLTDHTNAGFNGLSYDLELNYTKGTANVVINHLQVSEDKTYSAITLSDVPFAITKDGWIEVSSSLAEGIAAGQTVKFSNFKLAMCDRVTLDGRYPGFYARYTVDSKYSVLSAVWNQYQFGTTTSTYSGGSYSSTETTYLVGFDIKAGTINIMMRNTRFVDKMPAMNILLEKIPFTISGTTASFRVDEIIPKIGDTPYPGFKITNLSGYYDFTKGMVMNFNCKPETMPFDFTVSVDCKFTYEN